MNVNMVTNNPTWLWYLLAGILVQVTVTLGWLLLKFTNVCRPTKLKSFADTLLRILQIEIRVENFVEGTITRAISEIKSYRRGRKRMKDNDVDVESGKVKMS